MADEYLIEKLNDFLKVPENRLDDCLAEFKVCLGLIHAVNKKTGVTATDLTKFQWIDDKKYNITVNVNIQQKGEK
jgi:hypothetical protein